MNTRILLSLAFAAAAAPLVAGSASKQPADIPTRDARQAIVDSAAALSHPVDLPPLPADLKNPFTMDAVAATGGGAVSKATKATRDTLDQIANDLANQGVRIAAVRGNASFLQIGRSNTRFSKGDKIPVKLATGETFDVTVADIPNTTTYVLELNGEQATRTTRPTGR